MTAAFVAAINYSFEIRYNPPSYVVRMPVFLRLLLFFMTEKQKTNSYFFFVSLCSLRSFFCSTFLKIIKDERDDVCIILFNRFMGVFVNLRQCIKFFNRLNRIGPFRKWYELLVVIGLFIFTFCPYPVSLSCCCSFRIGIDADHCQRFCCNFIGIVFPLKSWQDASSITNFVSTWWCLVLISTAKCH